MGPSSLLPVIIRLKQHLFVQPTLPACQVEPLYREPGVESGYRPPGKPFSYYIISALQINNETVNIWSHLIAVVVFVLKFFILHGTFNESPNSWPFVAFGICATSYALLSTLAHTFHSKSPHLHYRCFQLDYIGIGLFSIGSNILSVYTACPDELYTKIGSISFALNVLLAWIYVAGCCLAKLKYRRPYPPQRKLIQLVSGTISVLPTATVVLYRLGTCAMDQGCSIDTLGHHLRWLSPFVLCIFFFSSHLPEKLYPGKFDFIGQGHQLFHVLVAVASVLQNEAGHIDIMDGDMSHLKLADHSLSGTLLAFCVYMFGCGVIMAVLRPVVNNRILADRKRS